MTRESSSGVFMRVAMIAVASVALLAMAACEPLPARLQLVVATQTNGADDNPGDGACTSAAAGGACTLQAALDEANTAADGADVMVPAGTYGGFDPTITGDVSILGTPGGTIVSPMRITVAAGGHLSIDWLSGGVEGEAGALALDVSGSPAVDHSLLFAYDVPAYAGTNPLMVREGGSVVVSNSKLTTAGVAVLANAGKVVVTNTAILQGYRWGVAVSTLATGETHAAATGMEINLVTALPACGGPGPVISHGYMIGSSCPAMIPSPADLSSGSSGIDVIPLGDPLCDTTVLAINGVQRGIDGDGDGIGGCDFGPAEVQP